MKTAITKYLTAVGLAMLFALSAATSSLAQRHPACVPQYDSSGAQTEPYCD